MITENKPPEHYVYKEGCDCLRCQLHRSKFLSTPALKPGDAVDVPTGKDETVKSFLPVLEENYQAQIAGYYNYDKTDEERAKRNAVIEEYEDLISIYKANYHSPVPVKEGEQEAVCSHCGDTIENPLCRNCEIALTLPDNEY